MEVYDGQVLFSGLDANGLVTSLWTTDGTAAGTQEVTPIANTWSTGLHPTDLTAIPPPHFFNNNDSANILWQNTNGQAAIWEMNGTNVIGSGVVGPNPGPSWTEIGTGDFYDNGLSDILWQNANGQAAIWEMNGTNLIGGGTAGPNPGPSWQAIGTGDFNDDGHSDILWQNADGQAAIWEMNGTNLIGGGLVGPNPGPELESGRNRRLQRRRPFRHPVAERERSGRDLGNERNQRDRQLDWWAPIPGPVGKRLERATSTTTAILTSCGRTRAVRPRSGK